MAMRKSRLSQNKQLRLIEHFATGTTARCAADPTKNFLYF
jgi:transposase